MTITQEMTIPEIIDKYPQTKSVFVRHGIQPEGYKSLAHENLFATARVHQLDLTVLLHELNQSVG